jgi:hypothetical protein
MGAPHCRGALIYMHWSVRTVSGAQHEICSLTNCKATGGAQCCRHVYLVCIVHPDCVTISVSSCTCTIDSMNQQFLTTTSVVLQICEFSS